MGEVDLHGRVGTHPQYLIDQALYVPWAEPTHTVFVHRPMEGALVSVDNVVNVVNVVNVGTVRAGSKYLSFVENPVETLVFYHIIQKFLKAEELALHARLRTPGDLLDLVSHP